MKRQRLFTIAIIGIMLLSIASFGGVAMGTESDFGADVSASFVCDNEGAFTDLISNFLTLFVFGSPVAGVIVYFVDRSADSFAGGGDGIDFWIFKNGTDALKAGFLAPIGLYALQFILNVAFGIRINCITP